MSDVQLDMFAFLFYMLAFSKILKIKYLASLTWPLPPSEPKTVDPIQSNLACIN